MRLLRRLLLTLLLLAIAAAAATPGHAAPEGQMTWAVHFALAPTWFDPAETSGIITPFGVLSALHAAMVKPLPGNPMAPSLSEAWIVPKKYVEKVGEDGFKKAPIGAGPYRFVSFTPGVELVLEAFEQYWRRTPSVKRLVFRAIPDDSTRLAALKRGEVDIGYAFFGALAEEARRTPGLTLKATVVPTTFWVYFADQWDPKSPWHDRRVRPAANPAIDRQTINQAENLGHAKITFSLIPASFDFYWH